MILLLLLLSLQIFAADEIIKSKDDIVLRTPDMFKFSDAGKISEFRGVVDRINFTHSDLKMADLYQFNTEAVKVDKALCMDFIEKIFALSKSNFIQLKIFKIVDSNKGKVCEALITEKVKPKSKNEVYYRFVSIGFINAKANVLIYHPNDINDDKISEIRKFWSSLR